jgi:1-acyl-sn-glycerol-3-phosphate acyltransferase
VNAINGVRANYRGPNSRHVIRSDPIYRRDVTVKRSRARFIPGSPALRRLWRVPRIVVHFFQGLGTIWFVFPSLDAHARRARVRSWSRRLLHLMNIDIRMQGALPHPNVLVVANHVSWLDIFALHAVGPVRFIAKSEIARWPLLGRLVRGVGTLFIERARRHDTHRVNQEVADALAEGDIVAVFPEGTVTDGTKLLPFKGSLLQPIIDAEGRVQPVAIRYRTPEGLPSIAPAYTDDTTFVESFWRICGERALVVELVATPALPARGKHRRELAHEAEVAIRAVLALPASDSGSDRPADQADESR